MLYIHLQPDSFRIFDETVNNTLIYDGQNI